MQQAPISDLPTERASTWSLWSTLNEGLNKGWEEGVVQRVGSNQVNENVCLLQARER